jgi:hypothetical protein
MSFILLFRRDSRESSFWTDALNSLAQITQRELLCCTAQGNGTCGFANAGSENSRFVTQLSPDIEVGFSYWFNPYEARGGYRLDALIAVRTRRAPTPTGSCCRSVIGMARWSDLV